jgi:hypothetical protein
MERRTPIALLVHLEIPTETPARESAWIENISSRGARVVGDRSWSIDDRVLLSSQEYGVRAAPARVVYCQPQPNDRFAIGLHFDHPIFESVTAASAAGGGDTRADGGVHAVRAADFARRTDARQAE